MRKIFTVLFAIFALLFSTQSLFAAVGDYKNNLLKIEITKLDENSYDIGLYTQKIYNEPVKVIKKTDTIYYFLLPETNNSVTSVTPNDAIKNVLIKSYPYAGQDMENSYTKVAIITSKPVNFSTSLRTLDTSVSPRLDPVRLAKLDKVFERYSDRLAENNIPTPLSEFRKQTVVAQKPELKSDVKVKEEKIASSKVSTAKPAQIAQKPKTQVVQKPKQTVQVATKPVQTTQKPKVQTIAKQQPAQTTKAVVVKPAAKQADSPIKPNAIATKPVQKQTSIKPVQTTQLKPTVVTVKPQTKEVQPKITYSSKKEQTLTKETRPQTSDEESIKLSQKETLDRKQVEEFEKQLATTEPIDAEFGKKVPVENVDENKEINVEIVEPIQNIPSENTPSKNTNNTYTLFGLFVILFILYIFAKKNTLNKKKLAIEAASKQSKTQGAEDIKEFLRKRTAIKKEAEETTNSTMVEEIQEAQHEDQKQEEPILASYNDENNIPTKQEPTITVVADEDENIQAFNAYMENINTDSSKEEETTLQALSDITEDDAVIAQLYTPIENIPDSYATYAEISQIQSLEAQQTIQSNAENNTPVEEENDDIATIVSSSKLTETRGLYLAKFEGATSLVGYIQDDIYVLYNFGDTNVQDTKIESSLAQENDTDSIYIVKTGGKKLMVKSTPYDMSLEMVM